MAGAIARPRLAAGSPRRRQLLRGLLPAAFFYPAFLLVACVSFFPLFYAIRQSLHSAFYLQIGEYVGFQNYVEAFTTGQTIYYIGLSIYFVLGSLGVSLMIGVGLALLLARPIPFGNLFRTILIFPWVVSQLVTGLLWMWLYNGRQGPFGDFLQMMGTFNPALDATWAMPSVILANAWHSYPLVMVFTMAALQTISPEVDEAAQIDASSNWSRFWSVTFPLIKSTLLVAAILTSLTSFNTVTLVLIMTGGGPSGATDVLALRVFKEAFTLHRMEVATTLAVVIFALNIAFSVFYIRVLKGGPK